MSNNVEPPAPPPSQTPSAFVVALQAFLRGLVRLLVIAMLIGLLGVAFYYALPLAYRELVLPVRETSARLDALTTQINSDRTSMSEQLKAVQTRLNDLETASAAEGAKSADIQGGVNNLRSDLVALQTSLSRLDQLEKDLKALDSRQGQTTQQLATMEQSLRAPGGKIDSLRRDVETLKAMNLLTRAEVNLAQNNFGLAKNDVLAARDVLLSMRSSLPEADQANVATWIARLDLALGNLPAFPLIAANDLETAYQLLALGVLPPAPTPGPITPTPTIWITPTLEASPTPTASPTANLTVTATPNASPSPTATPLANPTATPTSTAKP